VGPAKSGAIRGHDRTRCIAAHDADDVIDVPRAPAFLQAALAVVPLQLLAYRIARLRGLNVDQPRNLAKTVAVE
jgi:glucosamine--fructose-6-phosphate aminotransferase (isomerizing)